MAKKSLIAGIAAGLITLACIYGSIKGCSALNNVIIKDSVYQGNVISFGREGLIWKTYEGSFALGGKNRSKTGYFSLDEQARNGENIEKLAEQLKDAVNTGKKVRVHVTKPFFCWPWRSSSNSHVDEIEYIK